MQKDKEKSVSIRFAGGARMVTGSQFLLEAKDGEKVTRVLVDCGLEQGGRFCESANNEPFLYNPKELDAVFVTHAHADHIGLLPKLVKEGYEHTVYATKPTAELIPIMLDDAVQLIKREAERCGDAPPYDKANVESLVERLMVVSYHQTVSVQDGITATLYNAGHILGSALILLDVWGTRILFTGDLGRTPALLTSDPEIPERVDYLITESVYGAREHEPLETSQGALQKAVEHVQKTGGTLLVPSFSLERTQLILATLDSFFQEKVVSPIPVFLDSPLATKVTEVYKNNPDFLRDNLQDEQKKGNNPFSFSTLRVTYTKEDSKEIGEEKGAKIIIAGAGMSHGGRVRSHEKTYLPDPASMLLLVGYQTPGSLGRRLQDGTKEVVIDTKKVKVRAKVLKTGGFSAHADRDDLLSFAEKVNPKEVFVVLGEMESASFLAQRISGFLGIKTYIPQRGEEVQLDT